MYYLHICGGGPPISGVTWTYLLPAYGGGHSLIILSLANVGKQHINICSCMLYLTAVVFRKQNLQVASTSSARRLFVEA